MRVLLQRVSEASVSVEGTTVGAIGRGVVLLVGITAGDGEHEVTQLADKVANLRIFEDDEGKMNSSALELISGGEPAGALVISQFTLYGDVRKGRRPSFTDAAPPAEAAPMIERFASLLEGQGITVGQGVFGAHMQVALVNDGPVTIWIDTDDLRQPRRSSAQVTP